YPPVASGRFLFSGELSVTSLATGKLDENRITKGSCSRYVGVVPANGLLYTFAKGCTCWPMLKGFAALAPAGGEGSAARPDRPEDFPLQTGPAQAPAEHAKADPAQEWPMYRHDPWRSGSTTGEGPAALGVVWRQKVPGAAGRRGKEWRDNPFVPGRLTAPVVAAGVAVVASPDRHQVTAMDAATGEIKWQFTANGRVDTPPTIVDGRCLFGTRTGWVYCLRLADGKRLWRLRAAAGDRQIVAHGQVESPWPVAGSVLAIGPTVYFAAGRQYLADGGIRVFAVEAATGKVRWVRRIDSLPDHHYYGAAALEFDNYDLLVREGTHVSMSRWRLDAATGEMNVLPRSGFGHYRTGGGGVMAP
ncbi:hypothetical protein LCGC14_3032840, partial [marine sediment metagenome]